MKQNYKIKTNQPKYDYGLLVKMSDEAYKRPVTDKEEENRKRFESKVINLPWAELKIVCRNYHGHQNTAA